VALYQLYFQASEKSSWSSLEVSNFVVDCICQRESAECVGKQGTHSEWAKGKTIYSKLSPELKAEIGRHAAEHGVVARVRQVTRLLAMGVVNLN